MMYKTGLHSSLVCEKSVVGLGNFFFLDFSSYHHKLSLDAIFSVNRVYLHVERYVAFVAFGAKKVCGRNDVVFDLYDLKRARRIRGDIRATY